MRRTFPGLLAPTAMLVVCLTGQMTYAEDLIFHLPLSSVVPREKLNPTSTGVPEGNWRTEAWVKRAVLDGEGEIYLHSNQGEEFLAAKVPAGNSSP